jgi:hypothetical protein
LARRIKKEVNELRLSGVKYIKQVNLFARFLSKEKLMKSFIALVAALAVGTAFASTAPAKTEEVKKPAAAASAPATPKEMPKVEKPKTKAEKEAEAKAGKPADTKSEAKPAAPAKEAPKATDAAKK